MIRDVALSIADPLNITPVEVESSPDFEWSGQVGGPFSYSIEPLYTLENIGSLSVSYEVTVEGAEWLEVENVQPYPITLLPGFVEHVSLSVNENANAFNAGVYEAEVLFADLTSGYTEHRIVALSIGGNLAAVPIDGFEAVGPPGGPFMPTEMTYTLSIVSQTGELTWTASADPPVGWLAINGQPSAAGTLMENETAEVVVSIDTAVAASLGEGVYSTVVKFTDGGPYPVTREVSLTVVQPKFAVDEQWISEYLVQPGGPLHSYRMAAFQTTNAEFATFLNDARANSDNERGQYMYFDTDSGDAYINDQMPGDEGTAAPSATLTTKLYDASVGRIQLVGDTYVAQVGFEEHPVVGVSWFGALKYANWLTLDQGMPAAERCYTESDAMNLDGWHSIAITDADWATRPLNESERADLITGCRGYRLPMDDRSEAADLYNEWYKAAAWDPNANSGFGGNHVYGFGRDVLTGEDANYRCSGDPFEDVGDCNLGGTTPVGYYGGPNQDGSYPASPDDNAFGLFDMSGNVYEWIQDRIGGSPSDLPSRTLRGGSWADAVDSGNLVATFQTSTDATVTHGMIGFRVLRVEPPTAGDPDQDGDIDQGDFATMMLEWNGPNVEVPIESAVFDFNNDGDIDLNDLAAFQNQFTGAN